MNLLDKKVMFHVALFIFAYLLFYLSGCLGSIGKFACGFAPSDDKDHCFQFAAVTAGDASLCESIEGKSFKYSNPPKDKCYLQVANKTKDPSLCSKMVGGPMSYEPEECYDLVAKTANNPDLCKSLSGDALKECLKPYGLGPNYFEQKAQTEQKEKVQSSQEIQQQNKDADKPTGQKTPEQNSGLSQPQSKNVSSGEKQSDSEKVRSPTTSKPATPVSPSDLNLKPSAPSSLSPQTLTTLSNMPESSKKEISSAASSNNAQLSSQQKIPEPPTSGKPEEEKGYIEKAWDWLGWGAQKTSDALGDDAPKVTGTIGKTKEIYDYGADVLDAKSSIDAVNDKIASGKIDSNKGKLIKVGYGLGKGVKWVVSKIPIVGDPASTVADESIKAGMKFGEKLAEHTTKTDKCIEDPLSDDCID